MLFNLKSLCSNAVAHPSGNVQVAFQPKTELGMQRFGHARLQRRHASFAFLNRSLHARGNPPAGPRSSSPIAAVSTAWDRNQRPDVAPVTDGDRPLGARPIFGRHVLTDHQTRPILDNLELRANDACVRTQEQPARHEGQSVR